VCNGRKESFDALGRETGVDQRVAAVRYPLAQLEDDGAIFTKFGRAPSAWAILMEQPA